MERELLYKKIYDDLTAKIIAGEYGVGDRLPSEKELMDIYGVCRITSKKALEMLAERGIVVRMPGRGTFVAEGDRAAMEEALSGDTFTGSDRSSGLIGVILDSFGVVFGCDIISGIEKQCRKYGYNMILNEESSNISAGQKQLLTIARAILADTKLLILDEATSSVDTRTEMLIQKAMDNLMQGRTSFVIAHRLSTIKNADLILCMKDGDIVEQGSHDELMALNGFYAQMYNSQFEKVS